DESRRDAATLRVVVVDTTGPSPETVADYTISGKYYLFSATLAATGYFTDRATRVDFDMSLEASPLKSTFRSTFDLSPQSARVAFNVTFVPASANSVAVAVDYRITTGARNVAASGALTVTRTPDGDSLSRPRPVPLGGRRLQRIQ